MSLGPFWRALVDFVFPPKCPLCGGSRLGEPVDRPCPACLSRLSFLSSPQCPRCGIGFPSPSETDHLCSACLTEERYFTRARAICRYEGAMVEAISRYKFGGVTRLAKPLGHLLAECRDPDFPLGDSDLVIPVPLHPSRLRQRGFNQSLLLARYLCSRRDLRLDFTSLRRARPTQPQTRLSGPERQTNVKGAFEVKRPDVIAHQRVLLVDDVFTTGATIRECSKALLQAGAEEVNVLTLARVS